MRGQLHQRVPGSWTITLYLGCGANGKRRYRNHVVRGTKRDAERERVRLLRLLDTGVYQEASRETVETYLERWLTSTRHSVAARTHEWYSDVVRKRLSPAFGSTRLDRLTPAAIKSVYAAWLEGGGADGSPLSGTTVLGLHRVLHKALQDAVQEGVLVANPTDRVEAPRKARPELNVLNAAQSQRLFELTRGTDLHIPTFLALGAGLRRGEILGLRWSDIDFERRLLTVRQTLQETRTGLLFGPPKTDKSARSIPLPAFVAPVLREHRAAQAAQRLRLGQAYVSRDLVVALPEGAPYPPGLLSVHFFKFVQKHPDLPRVRFHDLRHSHATLLLAAGVHPKVMSERLGHSSISVTMDAYSHVTPTMQEEAAAKLDQMLGHD